MKQPKVTNIPPPPPAPATLRGPRYRYFSTTPATVTLRMRDLQVPQKARTAAYDSEQFVDLPCEEIFRSGPVPKIRLSRLAELAPDCVTAGGLPDEGVKLCSARLALAYVVTEGRELIEEPPAPEPPPPPAPPLEEFAPPILPKKPSEPVPPAPAADVEQPKEPQIEPPKSAESPAGKASGLATDIPARRRRWMDAYKAQATSSEPPSDKTSAPAAPAAEEPSKPLAELPAIAPGTVPSSPAPILPPPIAPPPPAPPVEARRPFSLFPKFRRKEDEEPKPSTAVPRSRIEIPKPKRPIVPLTTPPVAPRPDELPLDVETGAMPPIPPPTVRPPAEPAKIFEPKTPNPPPRAEAAGPPSAPAVDLPPPMEPPAEANIPRAPETPAPAPVAETPLPPPAPVTADLPPPPLPVVEPVIIAPPAAVLVETEHLPKEQNRPEIAEQDALQAIFLTEEFLSVDRVLELCGNLPGIRSCVLSSGANIIASHNAPDSVDIISLSAHALEMIKAMRSSAAKMGIGAVPAVTVHSEKGPITFFHQDDLCLLVLHKDRGFIPGVREKLQEVVTELSQAKLPLRLGQGTGKKMLGSKK